MIDAGNIVICNVLNGSHYVLATSYSGNSVYVNDPLYSTSVYAMGEIVDGQNVVYRVQDGRGNMREQ